MKKITSKITTRIFLIILIILFTIIPKANIADNKLINETILITDNTLKFITPPSDFRAYFMLQSIDDTSVILIGNFTGPEKIVTLITDENSDNTIDSVVEYFPEKKKFRRLKKIESKSIKSDIAELKKDIIEGIVFEKNYSYKMSSLPALKKRLVDGRDIFFTNRGTRVVSYDPEKTLTIMNDFFFRSVEGRCDLMFKTNYYKLYHINISPPILFSVYCRNSKDPIVAKYVKELIPMAPR